MTAKEIVKNALHRVGLYRPVSRLANDLIGTAHSRWRRQLLTLYRPLIVPGELVFDVGGHDGSYAEVFAVLGARVVTIEPNPACMRQICQRCPASVTVVRTAVGAAPGVATLKMSSGTGHSGLSSLSESWLATARQAPRFRGVVWDHQLEVPVTTLDVLIKRYGEPAYMKIDIEGYEEAALNGLSRQPRLLSLEYNTEALAALIRCLRHRVIAPTSRFNYVAGFGSTLALQAWIDAETFQECVNQFPPQAFGDVFIRR